MSASELVAELRRRDPLLFGAGVLMAIALAGSALAFFFDDRLILGLNPWIKPAKFEISLLIFLWTLAWFMPEVRAGSRTRAFIRWTPPIVMTVEIVLIVLQAARGTTSHFNNNTPMDDAIFSVMGIMITVNTVAMLAMLLTLRRDTPPDRAGYLWGMRMGIAIFILASLQGFVIVANNAHTVASARRQTRPAVRQLVHGIGRLARRALRRHPRAAGAAAPRLRPRSIGQRAFHARAYRHRGSRRMARHDGRTSVDGAARTSAGRDMIGICDLARW